MSGSARDPFAILGLSPDSDLSDDDVRIAWRRIAAATHPDRADGGDPDRFALAAAAYTELRTEFGRNEAMAGPTVSGSGGARTAARRRLGQPGRLARLLLKLAVAAAAAVLGGTAAGWGTPAAPALVVGALTWFLASERGEYGRLGLCAGRDGPGGIR